MVLWCLECSYPSIHSLRGTTEIYKGKDLYSLVFQKEFTEICGCWAVRNCVCSSVICTDFIVPDVKSFSYHELDPVLWSWEPNLGSAKRRQDTFFFSPGLSGGRKQTLIYLRVFVCEPELVFKVALTYLPARPAFRVWPGHSDEGVEPCDSALNDSFLLPLLLGI